MSFFITYPVTARDTHNAPEGRRPEGALWVSRAVSGYVMKKTNYFNLFIIYHNKNNLSFPTVKNYFEKPPS